MTLSPSDDRNTKGVDGPKYELNKVCPVPGCGDKATERHHMWRRSDVIGDHWWVQIGSDEKPVPNCIKLCHHHHISVTENIARITYTDNIFRWLDPTLGVMELTWQPPTVQALEQALKLAHEAEMAILEEPVRPEHDHLGVEPGSLCPACHRLVPLPRAKRDPEAPRIRKTYCVAVPEDRWEDGADVVATLLEEARREMGKAGLPYGEADTVRYYVLATALALFVQNAPSFLSNG